MSPASYLAAPPRVAASSLAPFWWTPFPAEPPATVPPVDWTIYGALIAGFVAIAVGVAVLVRRALHAWRSFKQLTRRLGEELEQLAAVAEKTSATAERVGDQSRLDESLRRLRITLARFAVLRNALDEANETFGRFALVPRK
jgi:hypothetical protein